MLKKYSKLAVAAVLFWLFAISLIVSSQESTTMDEQAHIPAGYTYVKYQDMRLNPEHPPLLKDLAGFPLLFMKVEFPLDSREWQEGINEQWTLGNRFIHENDADAITFWSRFPIILVTLLLGFFVYLWTKELAGVAAGIFALILYAFDPNIIAHGHYVTTDIGIAAAIFISFYYFIKFVKNPNWKNIILAGLFLGVAQLTKFSAVLLFPYFALIIFIYAIFKKKPDFIEKNIWLYKLSKLWEYAWKYATVVVVCFVLIFFLYLFNTWNMPAEKVQDIAQSVFHGQDFTFSELKHSLLSCDSGCKSFSKNDIAQKIVIETSKIPLLKGLSEYLLGVFMVFVRVAGGNTYYFFGEVSNQATKWYFPAVFVLKETLIFLSLLAFSLIYALAKSLKSTSLQEGNWRQKVLSAAKSFFQTKVVQYSMLGFIAFYAYLSITGNLNIGFRHLFPILPFVYVLIAATVFNFYKNIKRKKAKMAMKYLIVLFAIIAIFEPIIHYPSYLSYFNEAAGGPKNGYRYVTDSNYDWGQDLKRLRNWVDDYNNCLFQKTCKLKLLDWPSSEPIDKIRVDYFGGSNPAYYFGSRFIPWHSHLKPEPGWYGISIGFLQENLHKQKNPGEADYQWLRDYAPVGRAGDSIFIYYIPELEKQQRMGN